jgi:hypothetical protein
MQLAGPVPPLLYHRYVEFKPFVAGMFTDHSLRGRILNRALHHQHGRIYNYDRTTLYGIFPSPCLEMTQKFLDFTFYGQGGRIFTYVMTLDGMFRFTETGKEFGIDMLSKHTMHSNVSIYTACSGEFFVRRYHRRDERPHHEDSSSPVETSQVLPESPDGQESVEDTADPTKYELVIDNDSGTYRPNPKCLPVFREFLASNFLGLHITTIDCQADEELMGRLKEERRREKAQSKEQIMYTQRNNRSDSSLSSSDEEDMTRRAGGAPTHMGGLSGSVPDKQDIKNKYKKWLEGDKSQRVGEKSSDPVPPTNGATAQEKVEHEKETSPTDDASTNGPQAVQN